MLTDICTHPGFAKDLIPVHTLAPSKSRGFAATRGLFVDLQLPDSRALGQIPVHSGSVIDPSGTTSSSIASP